MGQNNIPQCGRSPNSTLASATVKRAITLPITVIDNEARVLDTALAAQLGMARPTNIRAVIEDHRDELEGFGGLHSARANPGPTGGRPTSAFYLNRRQALLVCILSKTEKAKAVRAEVVRVFTAYETLTLGWKAVGRWARPEIIWVTSGPPHVRHMSLSVAGLETAPHKQINVLASGHGGSARDL